MVAMRAITKAYVTAGLMSESKTTDAGILQTGVAEQLIEEIQLTPEEQFELLELLKDGEK